MAQDKKDKVIRLALAYSALAVRATDLIRDSRALQARVEQDGIIFADINPAVDGGTTTYESQIQAAGGAEHLTANILNACITNLEAMRTFLATGTGTIDGALLNGNLEDALYQARPD